MHLHLTGGDIDLEPSLANCVNFNLYNPGARFAIFVQFVVLAVG